MKCPEELTREMVWALLGEYAADVAYVEGEGVFFTKDRYVLLAAKQYERSVQEISDE